MRLDRFSGGRSITDIEYQALLGEIDALIRIQSPPRHNAVNEAAELFADVGRLWDEATPSERRTLVAPLLDHAYVDIDTERISALAPLPAFDALLCCAVHRSGADVRLIAPGQTLDSGEGMDLVETGGFEPPTSALRTQRSPN